MKCNLTITLNSKDSFSPTKNYQDLKKQLKEKQNKKRKNFIYETDVLKVSIVLENLLETGIP